MERWLARPPTVDQARPSHCPACGAPSRPVGERLALHGHGTRMRQCWGLLDGDREPQMHDVPVRRYRCRRCRATLTVRPEDMAPRYLYRVATMAAALWSWSQRREPARQVRRRLSPLQVHGLASPRRWKSLERWTHGCDRLWPDTVRKGGETPVRKLAAALCTRLAAFGDRPFTVEDDGEAAACRGAVARLAR